MQCGPVCVNLSASAEPSIGRKSADARLIQRWHLAPTLEQLYPVIPSSLRLNEARARDATLICRTIRRVAQSLIEPMASAARPSAVSVLGPSTPIDARRAIAFNERAAICKIEVDGGKPPPLGYGRRYPFARPFLRSPISTQNVVSRLCHCLLAWSWRQRVKHLSRRGKCTEGENVKDQHSTIHKLSHFGFLQNFC